MCEGDLVLHHHHEGRHLLYTVFTDLSSLVHVSLKPSVNSVILHTPYSDAPRFYSGNMRMNAPMPMSLLNCMYFYCHRYFTPLFVDIHQHVSLTFKQQYTNIAEMTFDFKYFPADLGLLLCKVRPKSDHRRISPRQLVFTNFCLIFIMQAGVIETNPGNDFPCQICNEECDWSCYAVGCDLCDAWFHAKCLNMSTSHMQLWRTAMSPGYIGLRVTYRTLPVRCLHHDLL